ncbi:MAG: hypothetical protein ACTSRK_15970 [Promethearchaeota archaeon]
MFEKLKTWWTTVDKPEKERVYHKGKISYIALFFLLCYGLGWIVAWAMESWKSILITESRNYDRYAFESWASSYFVHFFLMTIPIFISMTINSKSKTPAYGFAAIGGFFGAALSYIPINSYIGLYMSFVVSLAILGNLPSQGDFTLKWGHLLYYFLLGIYASYFNTVYQLMEWDVWVWLQMIHIHLFTVIIAAMKIRQWSYMYMLGWAVAALATFFFPADIFIFRLEGLDLFPLANLQLAAIYNIVVPPMLTFVILFYFFNIQRKVKGKYIGMDK